MSPRGTIAISPAMPTGRSAKPSRMMLLGRRAPAFLPASSATPNIVSESGAIDRPVCIALYSSTICRKIGIAIIAPPSAICWSIWPVIPNRNSFDRNRSGSISAGFASRFAVDEPVAERSHGDRADRQERRDGLAAFLPHQDAQDEAAHAEDGEDRADRIDVSRSGVRHVLDATDVGRARRDDHDLEREADAPREERGDEAAEQRSDRRGDRGRGTDQGIHPLLRRSFEVAVDERLHRGQQERGAEPTDHGPEHDDRGHALRERHRQRADGVREQPQHVRLSCGR